MKQILVTLLFLFSSNSYSKSAIRKPAMHDSIRFIDGDNTNETCGIVTPEMVKKNVVTLWFLPSGQKLAFSGDALDLGYLLVSERGKELCMVFIKEPNNAYIVFDKKTIENLKNKIQSDRVSGK